jgi:hypothetical protein
MSEGVLRRIARALHTALGRWLAKADQPARTIDKRKSVCWFDVEPGALAPPREPDDEDEDDWYRRHFRINGQPWKK